MSDFVLKSEYTPTGDQPEAIASLTAGIASGRKMQTLLGVTGSGKTFTLTRRIVYALSPESGGETIPGSGIDVPTDYYQIIISQEGMDVRALALIFSQEIGWDAWPARHIATIDEIERLTGLDFNPELPSFIQDPLESDLPNRLWPIRPLDIIRQIAIRFM